jgi:hypothetical protein
MLPSSFTGRSSILFGLAITLGLFNVPVLTTAQDATGEQPAAAPAPVAAAQATEGFPGRLVGLDGRTPWAQRTIRLVDAEDGTSLAMVTTGPDGSFRLPIEAGHDYLLVVGKLRQALNLPQNRPLRELRIMLPRDVVDAREAWPIADQQQEGGLVETAFTTGSIVAIVGGVVVLGGVAGGAAVVANNNQGGSTGGNNSNVGIVPPPPVSQIIP